MKKILLAISMMLSLMACVKEVITLPSETVDTDGEVVLNLSAVVPEAQIATKGTFAAPTITSLNVLMFDDKGFMVANAVAYNENATLEEINTGTASKLTEATVNSNVVNFKVILPKTGNSCTLHFVANANVSNVEYGMETDIITSLATVGTQDAYWQKVNLPRLIDKTDLTSKCPVQLIRNHAKVTLVSSVKTFKPTGYALINYPKSGTVAPYNTNTGAFQVYNEGNKGRDFDDLVADKYSAFMPADCGFSGYQTDNITWTELTVNTDGQTVSGAPLYTYESIYGNTFLMVKGIYDYNKDSYFTESESYYKIDFYDPSLGNCDILRNINYQFSITNVIGPGYPSVAEAANPDVPAGNNISNSLLTQSLINISDGTQHLSVEYTSKYLTSDDPFTLKYMFQPDLKSNTTRNTLSDGTITIATEVTDKYGSEDIKYNVLDPGKTNGYSTIQIEPQDFPVEGQIYSKRITITSNYDGVTMSRIVDLYFIHAYEMTVACDPKKVAASAGSAVTVRTTIPGNLPSVLFPLVFDIESDMMSLYPDTVKELADNDSENAKSMPVVSGTSTINGVDKNTFHYQRTLTEEEYRDLGGEPGGTNISGVTFNSYFKTSKAESASKVYVSNPYFTQNKDYFVNESSLIEEGFYGAGNTVELIYTTTGKKTFTATGAHFSNGTNTMSGTATTETPFVQTLTTIDWNKVVKVNDGAADITGKARTKLRMTATSDLSGNVTLGVYEDEASAKSMTGSIAKVTTSDLSAGKAILNKSGLADTKDLYFSYTDGSHVYVANATAKALHEGAELTFTQNEMPLSMQVEFGDGADRYGSGQAFTLTFTTNKTGTYVINSMNFDIENVSTNAGFQMTAGVPVTVNCTSKTWSDKAKIIIQCDETVTGENPQTFTGPDRNKLYIKPSSVTGDTGNNLQNVKMSTTQISSYNWNNVTTVATFSLDELRAGVEVEINNLNSTTTYYLAYRYGNRNYRYESMTAENLANGTPMSFVSN